MFDQANRYRISDNLYQSSKFYNLRRPEQVHMYMYVCTRRSYNSREYNAFRHGVLRWFYETRDIFKVIIDSITWSLRFFRSPLFRVHNKLYAGYRLFADAVPTTISPTTTDFRLFFIKYRHYTLKEHARFIS